MALYAQRVPGVGQILSLLRKRTPKTVVSLSESVQIPWRVPQQPSEHTSRDIAHLLILYKLCPSLYSTVGKLHRHFGWPNDKAHPAYLSIKPTVEQERFLRQNGYIASHTQWKEEVVPEFTEKAWALRPELSMLFNRGVSQPGYDRLIVSELGARKTHDPPMYTFQEQASQHGPHAPNFSSVKMEHPWQAQGPANVIPSPTWGAPVPPTYSQPTLHQAYLPPLNPQVDPQARYIHSPATWPYQTPITQPQPSPESHRMPVPQLQDPPYPSYPLNIQPLSLQPIHSQPQYQPPASLPHYQTSTPNPLSPITPHPLAPELSAATYSRTVVEAHRARTNSYDQ